MNIYKDDPLVFYGDRITFHCRDVLSSPTFATGGLVDSAGILFGGHD
jgi:hypothetical protein